MNVIPGRRELKLGTLLWCLGSLIFVGLRITAGAHLPVAGAELSSLAGAWNETLGINDPRFLGSLCQSLVSFLLRMDAGAGPARGLVIIASASVPLSLFLARERLGETAALTTLLIISLDPVSLLTGSTASANGLDLAVCLWLLTAVLRGVESPVLWAILGLAAATSGPLPLLLAGSFGALSLLQNKSWNSAGVAGFAAGIAAGVGLGSLLTGPAELRVPPFEILQAGVEADWAGAGALELSILYEMPILLAGSAATANALSRPSGLREMPEHQKLLLLWAMAGGLYWLFSLDAKDPTPVLALTVPLAALIGTVTPSLITAVMPAGSSRVALVTTAAAVGAGTLLLLSGTFAVAGGSGNEPLIAPANGPAAQAFRERVIALAPSHPGGVFIHPDVSPFLTWPLRDSVTLVATTRVNRGDALVIWPADAPAPNGYAATSETWLIVRNVTPPTGDIGEIFEWFRNRNQRKEGGITARIYTGVSP